MGEEEKSVLDKAVDALNRTADEITELNNILCILGMIASDGLDVLKSLDETLKTLKVTVDSESFDKVVEKQKEEKQPEEAVLPQFKFGE